MYKTMALFVNFLCSFNLSQSCSANVEKVVGKGDALALKVRDNPECSNRSMKDGTVEFTEDICSSGVARNNDEWTSVARFHFGVE